MKKIFKMAAMLLGCTGCLAQCPKNNLTDNSDEKTVDTLKPDAASAPKSHNALAFIQDIDKIYYL